MEVESYEKVAAKTYTLPSDEQQHIVVRQNQHQHEEHEQVQIPEEAVVTVIVRHVAGGVDMDQKTDARHHQDHHRAERVEQESPVGGERADAAVGHVEGKSGQPGELNYLVKPLFFGCQLEDRAHGKHERQQHHSRTDEADQLLEL